MTLLITGIHGFVGSNLAAALQKNHTIYGLDIIFPEKEGIVKTFSWDELDKIPEIDVIIHLAGKAHDVKPHGRDAIHRVSTMYFNINLGLTKTIFDYFLQSNAQQFIFFSSVKAAADSVEGDILTEDVIPKPVGPYGESKIQAEHYLQSARRLPLSFGEGAGGRGLYILRPSMIHGPNNKGNLNLLYNVAGKGIPWPLGAFENKRSFLNIWNLSYIIEQFIEKNPSSGIYHLADDEPLSTNELIELIAESKNRKPKIWKINKSLISFAAEAGNLLHLPLNSERLRKLTENYVVSNQKMKTALQIDKLPVSAREGLIKTIASLGK